MVVGRMIQRTPRSAFRSPRDRLPLRADARWSCLSQGGTDQARVQTLDLAVVKMADMQLGRQLTDEETALLTAFMNALSDKKLAAGGE